MLDSYFGFCDLTICAFSLFCLCFCFACLPGWFYFVVCVTLNFVVVLFVYLFVLGCVLRPDYGLWCLLYYAYLYRLLVNLFALLFVVSGGCLVFTFAKCVGDV